MSPAHKLWRCCDAVDGFSESTGKLLSWLILAVVTVLCGEVLLRSVFNSPTIWAHECSQYIYGVHFLLGGAYALKFGSMVNVDILVNRLKPRPRAIVDGVTGIVTLLFLLTLIWKGTDLALYSIKINEMSQTLWGPPIYPLKIMVVVGALFLGMQALAKLIRNIIFGISGEVWS